MSKKGDNFFEEHIEKIVLVVVGLVCIWLFLTRVLFSPNVVIYDNKKFSPGAIDDYILTSKDAADLKEKLSSKPTSKSYEPKIGEIRGLFDSAIGGIDVNGWPLPIHSSMDFRDRRKYRIPEIGEVNEVTMGYIRAVAYVPTVEINEEVVYGKAATEVNDIDFVTVEAKFDVKGLYERFYDNFAGNDVEEEEWRDPCLANPVFSDVQLQRQEALADGSWSGWQIVPRTRIDHRKKMFEVIEDVEDLPPGGMKVRLLQFDDRVVRIDLLQPKAYRIASAREEWFNPSLHKKFLKLLREEEMEERRAAMEAAREGREQEFEGRREERRIRSPEPWRRSGSGRYEELEGRDELFAGGGTSVRERRPRTSRSERSRSDRELSPRRIEREEREREKERERLRLARSRDVTRTTSVDDVYREFNGILITRRTDLARMREPLVFWAHDDTVEPEKRYRYRIRLGVFNPIAGTNQFSEEYRGFKNKVVLWSEFSDITEAVEVPGRSYFFARDIRNETAKIVTVQVSRYVLGYWHSKDFAVEQGEVIGKVVESETTSRTRRQAMASGFFEENAAAYEVYGEEELRAMGIGSDTMGYTVPETIDYTTGAVLVDVIAVNDWSGGKNLHRRGYFDMLYTFDGMSIERMPIRTRYWSKELKITFDKIGKSQKQPQQPFRDWGSKITGSAPAISQPEYGEEYYEEYLGR